MKIYFAGNITVPREREYNNLLLQRLFTFYYHGKNKEFNDEFKFKINENLSSEYRKA